MLILRVRLITLTTLLLVLASDPALAQVPPHKPGTICFTPQFWCWAQPPGPPGYGCYCPTRNGLVPGKLG
jgi:hypothetical protein